jgi:four helix bundle protein
VKVEGRRNSYRDLIIWQKSMKLTKDIYSIVNNFPKEEIYGLTSQVKRCAISIPSNIAEGRGRSSNKEFVRFLQISLGSLYELETQLELARELGFISDINKILSQCLELEKMINSMITKKGGRL